MTTAALRKGAQLPAIALPAAGGASVPLRGHRGPLVMYVVHAADCGDCIDYVRTLAAAGERLAEWGTTVRVVAESDDDALQRAAGDLRVLLDPEGVLVREGGDDAATLIVADEWGEIYFTAEAGANHASLPSVDELVEWAKFVAVQCPECEQPEGEWRKI